MNRLKSKIFWTIFTILSLFIIGLTASFNIQEYLNCRHQIIESLSFAPKIEIQPNTERDFPKGDKIPPDRENKNDVGKQILDKNTKFIDAAVYTVLIESGNIIDVINHSTNDLTNEEITNLATRILEDPNSQPQHIGCLYFEKYSYTYFQDSALIITDNSNLHQELLQTLALSLCTIVLLEAISYCIAKLITAWIITPVVTSFKKQKQFIADASHELKTPLSIIIASSDLLESDPDNQKWLDSIHTEANRMNFLISKLLELSTSEAIAEDELKAQDLSKIISLAVLAFEGKAYEKGLKLKYDIDNNTFLPAREDDMKQLIDILLDNAIEHSKPRGTIKINLKNNNKTVQLTVENKGKGIPAGEEELIFERFYRADKSRSRKENHYGLGLAIAKNIVEHHHGKISAVSRDDTTTFTAIFKK